VDYLPIDAIAGRIATTPFVVYPPGIATIVPGERLTERAQPMIDYLKMFEASFNAFPGFEVEIQGAYREVDASGRVRLHTYVVAEGGARREGQRGGMDHGTGSGDPMPSRGSEQPVVIRPSRDADVEPMLEIYRRHIRRGIEAGVDDSGTPQPD